MRDLIKTKIINKHFAMGYGTYEMLDLGEDYFVCRNTQVETEVAYVTLKSVDTIWFNSKESRWSITVNSSNRLLEIAQSLARIEKQLATAKSTAEIEGELGFPGDMRKQKFKGTGTIQPHDVRFK